MPEVLFVDQYAGLGGGQVVLLELLRRLEGRVDRVLSAPPGPFRDAAVALGVRLGDDVGGASRVVVNGARPLPRVISKTRHVPVTFVLHSQPATPLRRAVLRACLPWVEVLPVAGRGRRPGWLPAPPLGLDAVSPRPLQDSDFRPWPRTVKAFGRLDPVKGLDLLAEVLPGLQQRHPDLAVELAVRSSLEGRSPAYEEGTRRALGPWLVEGERSASWFGPGDLVVIPSRSEAVCLTAQEAMAAGAVVVGPDTGDLPDLVPLRFRPGDASSLSEAVEKALALSPEQAAATAREGQRVVQERAGRWYDWAVEHLAQ